MAVEVVEVITPGPQGPPGAPGASGGVQSVDGQTGAVALSGTYVPLTSPERVLTGADTTGVTEATTLINAAQAALTTGGVLRLPVGILKTTIAPTRSGVTYRGAGMWATTLIPPAAGGYMLQWGAFAPNITFEDMAFDFTSVASGSVALLNGITTANVRFTRCRFYNVPGYFIITQALSGLIFEDCVAHTAGTTIGLGVNVGLGSRKIEVRRNRFLYVGTGVSGTTLSDEFDITDNYFDQGWWLGVSKKSGSGGTVTYTGTTLTDTAGGLTGYIDHYVRAMTVSRSASGAGVTYDFSQNKVTDTGALFISAGTLKGDILRSGTRFAVVESVVSETVLLIEEWLSDANRLPIAQPTNGDSYTLYKVQLGYIRNAPTNTVVTVDDWYNLNGVRSTPAAGTPYEVIAHGLYPIHLDSCRGVKVTGNTLKRGWADQISIFGNEAQVIGNIVEDGQDFGLTIHGTRNVIACNRIRHQGVTGLLAGDNAADGHNVVTGNQVSGCTWTSTASSPIIAGVVVKSSRNLVTGNLVDGQSGALARYGISIVAATGETVTSNRIDDNIVLGHSVGDIRLDASGTGVLTATSFDNNTGTVSKNGAGVDGTNGVLHLAKGSGHGSQAETFGVAAVTSGAVAVATYRSTGHAFAGQLAMKISDNGDVSVLSPAATAVAPDQNSPLLRTTSAYWTGSASVQQTWDFGVTRFGGAGHRFNIVSPTGNYPFCIGSGDAIGMGAVVFPSAPSTSVGQLTIQPLNAAYLALAVKAAALQTADLQRWQESGGAAHIKITAATSALTASLVIGKAVLANAATDGFVYLPTVVGTPTGVPTTQAGTSAAVYDTTADKLWVYNGAWRGVVLA